MLKLKPLHDEIKIFLAGIQWVHIVCLPFFYVLVRDDKNVNKKTTIIFWIILSHITLLQIALLLYRFHWLTDLNFSTIYCILFLWLVNYLGDLAGAQLRNSIRARWKAPNHGVFVYKTKTKQWVFYIVNPNTGQLDFISSFRSGKKQWHRSIRKYHFSQYEKIII